MTGVFLIFGYGVPKNILKDENYNLYLKIIFNRIYDLTTKNNMAKPIMICSGGPTDCFKPYKRTEGVEMVKFFKNFIKQRPFLKLITKNWVFLSENKSLSTLENFLNSQKIIAKRKIKNPDIFIFCEQTRQKRIKILAKKIFKKLATPQIVSIDFDVSANRYLSQSYLIKKEERALKNSLWSLKSPKNMKKHRTLFEEKLAFFRKHGHRAHINVIKKWWDQKEY